MALKKRKGSKVPYSTARTSYGLLTDVIRAILDEPKRVYMGDWKMSSFNMAIFLADKGVKKGPACGTIGCILSLIHI